MIGDIITIKPEYRHTAQALLAGIKTHLVTTSQKRSVILIAGESGSGKSVTAICLSEILATMGTTTVLHLDDYFKLPPLINHDERVNDLNWVGTQEVNLKLLQKHLYAFQENKPYIIQPLMDYKANKCLKKRLSFTHTQFLIIEGTYSFFLKDADYHVFMERTYIDTYQQRMERGRDVQNEFVETVLGIEHRIIAPTKKQANALVKKDYSVEFLR